MHFTVFVDLFSLLSSAHTSEIFVSVSKSEMSLTCKCRSLKSVLSASKNAVYLNLSKEHFCDQRYAQAISKFQKVHSLTLKR